jgi:hypothetical protein
MTRSFSTSDAIRAHKAAREGLCERCNREYRGWSAASPLWNAVVRGGSINGNEAYAFLCPNCFTEMAEDSGIASCFQLRASKTSHLQMVTPTGRVWDDQQFLWVEKQCPSNGK